jgi:hypothetical protein
MPGVGGAGGACTLEDRLGVPVELNDISILFILHINKHYLEKSIG